MMKLNKLTIKTLSFLTLLLFADSAAAVFSGWNKPNNPIGINPNLDLVGVVYNITNWILGFVAVIAVLMIIWGGIRYLASAGDEDQANTGKRVITYGLYGLVLAGIAYAIVITVITWLT